MKNTTANIRQDIIGNGDRSTDRETFSAILNHWTRRLSVCSIFATVPAMLVSNIPGARADATKQTEPNVAGRMRLRERPIKNSSNPALLKRQSEFRLPHQKGSFNSLTPPALAGTDECPGGTIPGGNYTAAAPYTNSGDTTSANNTVEHLFYYYYYSLDASGPDHVYSFTLTGRGPNPQIEVSTTSGTFRPLIYVLQSGYEGGCPASIGNSAYATVVNDSRWTPGSNTARLDTYQVNYLPLNVPLHLLVDSAHNDASGAGAYTIRMQDVTIASAPASNSIDDPEFFVRQHYLDFLNRPADQAGLNFWTSQITSCGGDQNCIEVRRIDDSASFFLSIEFKETGYLVYKLYKTAYGNIPGAPVPVKFSEFLPDTQAIGRDVVVLQAGWEQLLENNKRVFAADFVQRSRFTAAFPPSTSAAEFVDRLNLNAGNPLSSTERDQLVSDLSGGSRSRAGVLQAIAEHPNLAQAEFNRAFVLMQYFGFLRRNPDDAPDWNFAGYNSWLAKLDTFHGNYIEAEMVKAFLSSIEYRQRFGTP